MYHKFILNIGITIGLGLASNEALARQPDFAPGAPGLGDPYVPLDGNGGYDVKTSSGCCLFAPEKPVLD